MYKVTLQFFGTQYINGDFETVITLLCTHLLVSTFLQNRSRLCPRWLSPCVTKSPDWEVIFIHNRRYYIAFGLISKGKFLFSNVCPIYLQFSAPEP